jgi:hypothetical protein
MTRDKEKQHETAARKNLASKTYLAKYGPRKIKVPDDHPVTFDNFENLMVSHAYNVRKEGPESWHETIGDSWVLTGHGVCGVLYEDSYDIGNYAGYLHLDHKDCWNKLSQCPCRIQFPTTAGELFRALRQVGSPAGLFISGGFRFIDSNPFQNDNPDL